MYRAVAAAALHRGWDLRQDTSIDSAMAATLSELARRPIDPQTIPLLQSPNLSQVASIVAQIPGVRAALVEQQQQIAAGKNIVCEGRDQGTVVFPNAECKFFLTATAQERALRRQAELIAQGQTIALNELIAQQSERDNRDARRSVAPLCAAADAVHLDTTGLSPDEVVQQMERIVRDRQAG